MMNFIEPKEFQIECVDNVFKMICEGKRRISILIPAGGGKTLMATMLAKKVCPIYQKNAFDCIILDEAHNVTADTYQKIMKHFEPKLWLGMTATPDKRDDNIAGKNVYELFNYQIAYEIRLQQAMEDKLLCPFHYFGITDLSIIGDDKADYDFSIL